MNITQANSQQIEHFVSSLRTLVNSERTKSMAARRIGVVDSQLHSWLSGRAYPTDDNLRRIADVYHVSLQFLTGETDKTLEADHHTYDIKYTPAKCDEIVEGLSYIKLPREVNPGDKLFFYCTKNGADIIYHKIHNYFGRVCKAYYNGETTIAEIKLEKDRGVYNG